MTVICLEDQTVNAIHLCLAAGWKRQEVPKKLAACSITSYRTYRGYYALQGTYVSYVDGLTLCSELYPDAYIACQTLLVFVDANVPSTLAGRDSPESLQGGSASTISTQAQGNEEEETILLVPTAEVAVARNEQTFLNTNLWSRDSDKSHLSRIAPNLIPAIDSAHERYRARLGEDG
jgi:hypothetical protein